MGYGSWGPKEWDLTERLMPLHAPEGTERGWPAGGLEAGGQGRGRGSSRPRLLPEPRAWGRHLGELKDLADRRGWERGNSGPGTVGAWVGRTKHRAPGPEVPMSAVRCPLLGRGGWVKRVFLTPHPFKNIPVSVEVFHSARVIVVSRDHCLLWEQMVFPSHSS